MHIEHVILVPEVAQGGNRKDDAQKVVCLADFMPKSCVTFGRRATCDVFFEDINISGHHCTITWKINPNIPSMYIIYVEDHSSNGCYINRERIPKSQPVVLKPDDNLSFSKPSGSSDGVVYASYKLIHDPHQHYRDTLLTTHTFLQKKTNHTTTALAIPSNPQNTHSARDSSHTIVTGTGTSRLRDMLKTETEQRLQLASELDELSAILEEVRAQAARDRDSVAEAALLIDTEKRKSQELALQLESLHQELKTQREKLAQQLEDEKQDHNATRSLMQSTTSRLTEEKNALASKLQSRVSELEELRSELVHVTSQLEMERKSRKELELKVCGLDGQMEKRQLEVNNLNAHVDQLKCSMQQRDSMIANLQEQLSQKNSQITSLTASRDNLQTSLNGAERRISDMQSIHENLPDFLNSLNVLLRDPLAALSAASASISSIPQLASELNTKANLRRQAARNSHNNNNNKNETMMIEDTDNSNSGSVKDSFQDGEASNNSEMDASKRQEAVDTTTASATVESKLDGNSFGKTTTRRCRYRLSTETAKHLSDTDVEGGDATHDLLKRRRAEDDVSSANFVFDDEDEEDHDGEEEKSVAKKFQMKQIAASGDDSDENTLVTEPEHDGTQMLCNGEEDDHHTVPLEASTLLPQSTLSADFNDPKTQPFVGHHQDQSPTNVSSVSTLSSNAGSSNSSSQENDKENALSNVPLGISKKKKMVLKKRNKGKSNNKKPSLVNTTSSSLHQQQSAPLVDDEVHGWHDDSLLNQLQ